MAYWITESAGKTGSALILLATCFFYTIRIESKRAKIKTFCRSFIILGSLLSIIAFINEHVTKEAIASPRPSHLFILKNSPSVKIDSLYRLEENKRRLLLKNIIETDTIHFKSVDQKVLDHWVEEAGFSFPSGHSFNAFLLAALLAFSMHHSRSKLAQSLYLLPLAWAVMVGISRVAIGAHSALDVSFGAGMGILLANLFYYFDQTRALISHNKKINR